MSPDQTLALYRRIVFLTGNASAMEQMLPSMSQNRRLVQESMTSVHMTIGILLQQHGQFVSLIPLCENQW
jgi:hypothetical protein